MLKCVVQVIAMLFSTQCTSNVHVLLHMEMNKIATVNSKEFQLFRNLATINNGNHYICNVTNTENLDNELILREIIRHSLDRTNNKTINPALFCELIKNADKCVLSASGLNLFVTNLVAHLIKEEESRNAIADYCIEKKKMNVQTKPSKLMLCEFLRFKKIDFAIFKSTLYIGSFDKMRGATATKPIDRWFFEKVKQSDFYGKNYNEKISFDRVVIRAMPVDGRNKMSDAENKVFMLLIGLIPSKEHVISAECADFFDGEFSGVLRYISPESIRGISTVGLNYRTKIEKVSQNLKNVEYMEFSIPEIKIVPRFDKNLEEITEISHFKEATRRKHGNCVPQYDFSEFFAFENFICHFNLKIVRIKIMPFVNEVALERTLGICSKCMVDACYLVCDEPERTLKLLKLLQNANIKNLEVIFTQVHSLNSEIRDELLKMRTLEGFGFEIKSTDENSVMIAEIASQMQIRILSVDFVFNIKEPSHQEIIMRIALKSENLKKLILNIHSDYFSETAELVDVIMEKCNRETAIEVCFNSPLDEKQSFIKKYSRII